MSLIAGTIKFRVGGVRYAVAGAFTFSGQYFTQEMLAGHDGVHGPKRLPKVPFIEGTIRDFAETDLEALYAIVDETIELELANGKIFMLSHACFAGDSDAETENGTVPVRFEGKKGAFV